MLAGLEGILSGPGFFDAAPPWPADLDSHLRFLSGVFVAVGIAWYSCIPDIEQKTGRFRLLAALTFCGGLGRFASLLAAGPPSIGHRYGLVAELLIVPAARPVAGTHRKEGTQRCNDLWQAGRQRPILRVTICASRQETTFPGALLIPRELSLERPVGFLIRRPPTL